MFKKVHSCSVLMIIRFFFAAGGFRKVIFGQLEMSGVHPSQKCVTFEAPRVDGQHSKKSAMRQASRRSNHAVAKYDYDAQNDGELSFSKGQRVQILDQSGDWWVGVINGTQGLVPSTHFRRN